MLLLLVFVMGRPSIHILVLSFFVAGVVDSVGVLSVACPVNVVGHGQHLLSKVRSPIAARPDESVKCNMLVQRGPNQIRNQSC